MRVGGHEIHYVNEGNTEVDLDRGSRSPDVGLVAEQREWFVVAMSSDGSAGADAYLVLGVGFFNVIQGVFALGLISLLGGGFLAFRGAGKPRTEPGDVAVTSVGENKTRSLR